MSVTVTEIIEAADLTDEETLTIVKASAEHPPVTTGTLVVLIDDRSALSNSLRHYPSGHPLRLIDTTFRVLDSSVQEALADLLPEAIAVVVDPIPLFDVRNAPDGVRGVMDRLRDPIDGCPWDNAQTHDSLASASARGDLRSAGSDRRRRSG